MARLFPLRSETSTTEGQPRVVGLDDEDADAVFGALSSTTAREIYAHLSEEPGTPSDIAEAVDSSIQNVRYHLEKLEDAGLVEVVDTWYSSRGNEMSVYAPADGPLIVTNDRSRAAKLRDALSRFVSGIGALAGMSVLVQFVLSDWSFPTVSMGSSGDTASEAADGGYDEAPAADTETPDAAFQRNTTEQASEGEMEADAAGTPSATETPAEPGDTPVATETTTATEAPDSDDMSVESTPTETTDTGGASEPTETPVSQTETPEPTETPVPQTETPDLTPVQDAGADAAETAATLPPGLLFFLGGLAVLLIVSIWWYRSSP